MKNKIRFSIRSKYIAGLLIVLAAITVVFMLVIPQIYREMLDNEQDKIKLYNINTASNLNIYFSVILKDLEFLSSLIQIRKFNFNDINPVLFSASSKKGLINNFFICNDKGEILYNLNGLSMPDKGVFQKYYSKRIRKTDTADFYYDYSEEKKDFILFSASPIYDNGILKGHLFGIIDLNNNDILENSIANPLYYEWQLIITSSSGFLIYHSDIDISGLDMEERDFSDYPSVKSALLGNYDIDTVLINNSGWFTVSEKIKEIKWFAVVQIPKRTVTDKIKKIVLIYAVLLFLTAVFILAAVLFLSDKIIKPLESLSRSINDFAVNKKISEIHYDRNDEIKDIIKTFFKMTDERISFEKEIQEISEKERLRIGQDLHDDLGQILTSISLQIIMIEQELDQKSAEAGEYLNEMKTLLANAIDKTRFISKGLYPVELFENGIIFALKELVNNTNKIFNINCRFDNNDEININDRSKEINLYRIIQEFINNALKHAHAEIIIIKMEKEENKVRLTCSDNGKGFEYEKVSKGIGLKSMQYRAGLLNASFELSSVLGKGTALVCIFNL